MTWKIALALSALVALSGCGGGAGGDDCTHADAYLAECTPTSPGTTSSSSSGSMDACAGARLCRSQCISQYTCTQINAHDPNLTACLTNCQGK
jgi:hypothetical protein